MSKKKRRPQDAPPPPAAPATSADPGALWMGAFFLLWIAALNLFRVQNPDTWWHLKTGEWIWRMKAVPRVDVFSYTIAGAPWITFEWLSQLLFYAAYAAGGAAALTALKTVVVAAAFGLLWSLSWDAPAAALAASALAARGMRPVFVERPFIFDFLFLAALLKLFWNLRLDAPPRRLLWLLPALAALWANLHGGAAALAGGLVACAAAAEWAKNRAVPLGFWSRVAGLCFAALLVNPHGWRLYEQLWLTLTFPGKQLIAEWRAPTPAYHGFWIYAGFLAASAAAAARNGGRRPFLTAWTALFALTTFGAVRNIPLFLFCAAPLIVDALRGLLPTPGTDADRRWTSPAWRVALCAAIAVGAYYHIELQHAFLAGRFGLGTDEPLAGAAAFLDRAGVEGRMFNEYDTGGYLIWKEWPRRLVFSDGRNVEHGADFVRASVGWSRPDVWKALNERWGFDYAVLRIVPGTYSAAAIDADPDWQLAYWDDASMVYLRRTPANAPLLRRWGYEILQPDRPDYDYLGAAMKDPRSRARLLDELDRSVVEAPRCINALLLKADVLMGLSRFADAEALVQRAVDVSPDKAQPRFTLGWLYERQGDGAKAERVYRDALARLVPGEEAGVGADIRNNLGSLYERRGDLNAARREFEAAVRWNPDQRDARRNLSRPELRR